MHVDVLIIGQGISGTFLSYFLLKKGKSVIVIDDAKKNSPSRIAAGVINPVTGRRMVQVWMADEVMQFAWNKYKEIGNLLQQDCISKKNVIDFFSNPFMRENFIKRVQEKDDHLKLHESPNPQFSSNFQFDFGYGEIQPVYLAQMDVILTAWRKKLKDEGCLMEEEFKSEELKTDDNKVQYHNIHAETVIFCDGPESFNSKYFNSLPFAPNKGEALIVNIPNLPPDHIYKKTLLLAPLIEQDHFWAGSNYLWNFEDELPSEVFRQKTEQQLKEWLRIPFTVVDHVAGIRPATIERRPFVGMHPKFQRVGILNGMGTKGCSLAPYFANQLCNHLVDGDPIMQEANIARFRNVLSR